MLVLILIFCKKKLKIFYNNLGIMQWLDILLCAYQFMYKYRCLKAKVTKTNFLGNDIPKNMHYTYTACKNHLQVYLEKCKYITKKYKCPDS